MLFLLLSSCAQKPVITKFDGVWTVWEREYKPAEMCLEEKDVQKLREILIRCAKQDEYGE